MSQPAALYLTLRRDLSRPPSRRPGEAARVPIEGRICAGRRGKPCGSTRWHGSRLRGPVCASCGRGWPTRVVVEAVHGTGVRIPRERTMDLAAELGRVFAELPLWERRVFHAWELVCLACEKRVPHRPRKWRHLEVAHHLASHFPRAGSYVEPSRVLAIYDRASERVDRKWRVIERAYRGDS